MKSFGLKKGQISYLLITMFLHVKLIEAQNLPAPLQCTGIFGRLYMNKNKKNSFTTPMMEFSSRPQFNAQFKFPLNPKDKSETLHIQICSKFLITIEICKRDFDLSLFSKSRIIENWFDFEKDGSVKLAFQILNAGEEPFVVEQSAPVPAPAAPAPEAPEVQISKMRALFEKYDEDHNGRLDDKELESFFQDYRGSLRSFPKLCIAIYGSNGTISYDEFAQFYRDMFLDESDPNSVLHKVFNFMDTNKTGLIDNQEFDRVLDLLIFPENFAGVERDIKEISNLDYDAFRYQFSHLIKKAWEGSLHREGGLRF